MFIFKNPEDPFLSAEFISMISKYLPVKYINNCPVVRGESFFWSRGSFEGVKKEYLLQDFSLEAINPKSYKLFFFKPAESYHECYQRYNKNFRNAVTKSLKQNLDLCITNKSDDTVMRECYNIYKTNMDRMKTFHFSLNFFCDLCRLDFSNLWLVKNNGEIVSFGLVLGNLMFIQSSNINGKKVCANNFLYDQIIKRYDKEFFFFGVSSSNNKGLFQFKVDAGLSVWLAQETKFDIFQHLPVFFRDNSFSHFLLKFINPDKILRYCLPY